MFSSSCVEEDIDGQMVQLLAGNISTHVQQLQQLGLTSLKAQLQFEVLVQGKLNKVSTSQSPALPTRVVTIKGKVDKKSLSKEQKSIYLYRYVGNTTFFFLKLTIHFKLVYG